MNKLLTVLPAAGCMLVMCPLMMALMMRGRSRDKAQPQSAPEETARLRAEVQQLRDQLSHDDDVVS